MMNTSESLNVVNQLFQTQPKTTLYEVPGVDMTDAKFIPNVPLDLLDSWENNRELAPTHVADLMKSIEREGLHQSILVRPRKYGRYQILAGHHRVEALRKLHEIHPEDARYKTVHVLMKDLSDEDAARAVYSTNQFAYAAGDALTKASIEAPVIAQAEKVKAANPEEFAGQRVRDIAAKMMQEAGIKTSSATIARNQSKLKAMRSNDSQKSFKNLNACWDEALNNGDITKTQADALHMFSKETQEYIYDTWTNEPVSHLDNNYLSILIAAQNPKKCIALGEQTEKELLKALQTLKVLSDHGYSVANENLKEFELLL